MLKKFFFGNLRLKAMAFVMAVALWVYAVNKNASEMAGVVVPIRINTPPKITVLEATATQARIGLRGPQKTMAVVAQMIRDDKLRATFDPGMDGEIPVSEARHVLSLRSANLNLPPGVLITQIQPESIAVTLSERAERQLEVVVSRDGVPASGYVIADEFVFPRVVTVAGAKQALQKATQICTRPIDITGLTPDKNRTFPWSVGIAQQIFITEGDETRAFPVTCSESVDVWLRVEAELKTRSFENIRVHLLRTPELVANVILEPGSVDLAVKGPAQAVDGMRAEDVTAFVDIRDFSAAATEHLRQVSYLLPDQVALDQPPTAVKVKPSSAGR